MELKYHRQIRLACWLGNSLGDAVAIDPRLAGIRIDGIVPAPLHPVRQRERGFNQAELLAQRVSARIKIPVSPLLRRIRYTNTQTERGRRERMENLRDAFALRGNAGDEVRGKTFLVVDDVFTTGSTVEACSRVLKRSGARVFAATVARG